MSTNVADKWGTGLKPQQFIDSMSRNQEDFLNWYNQFTWTDSGAEAFFASLAGRTNLRCLILAADWCGDVVRNVPVLFRALEKAEIPVEVLIMEQHLDLMDQFLTMGGRAIPIAIFADEKGNVRGHWGPRPRHIQEVMVAFKQANPDREAPDYQEKLQAARAEMLARYGDGTQYQTAIVTELRDLLSTF
ncbi:MAG: thioredoxin family protein [Brevibacillus sp.]|nr:thioredoxin family protein [Brevibacillus sp.]